MPSIKDNYEKLKLSIVGTKTTDVDKKLDDAIDKIVSFKSKSGSSGYIDLVRSLIAKSAQGSTMDLADAGGIFSQNASPIAFGQGGRLARYKMMESIVTNINYCYRALEVLTDNILSPDNINKTSLEITSKYELQDGENTESKIKLIQETIEFCKVEKYLHDIIKNTLKFGDFFCEIAETKTALTSRAILAEVTSYLDSVSEQVETFTYNENNLNLKVNLDYSTFNEAKDDKADIKNINMVFHDPSYVIKLQSDVFPLCFGYLVFPKSAINPQLQIKDQAVNDICRSILTSLHNKIPQIKEFSNNDELVDIIKTMVMQTDQSRVMNVRYIPPDRMQHFKTPSTKYYPYGESIFESAQFTSKVLIALETALAVSRISRSTEKRKIAVEIGLPRDAKKMIEKLKEEFRKRKVSLDSYGTIDTIPSTIATFEDVYVPQKDGKPFVDISTFNEGNVDIRSKVDELKFMRDSVVASLGVPASFLNIEENLSNKNSLSEESILFARTIVSHQKHFSINITELIEKILQIANPEEALTLLDNIIITLPPPKSLQFEREARYMSELANLVETLERIGVPKEYSRKKYLTNIDWTELEKYKVEGELDKNMGIEKDEDATDFGGGMGGF